MNDSPYQEVASSDPARQQWRLDPAGWLSYWPAWLDDREATQYFNEFERALAWQQRPITLFGRQVLQPRLTAFYGDVGISYRYSGKTLQADGWPLPLAAVRDALETHLGERFNSVLCNLYRDGRDGMGWHADNEPELGKNPLIASVSLGSRRRFRLKPRSGDRRLVLEPAHGSLIVMAGDIQRHWLHEVPKTRRVVDPRINLTFRQITSNKQIMDRN